MKTATSDTRVAVPALRLPSASTLAAVALALACAWAAGHPAESARVLALLPALWVGAPGASREAASSMGMPLALALAAVPYAATAWAYRHAHALPVAGAVAEGRRRRRILSVAGACLLAAALVAWRTALHAV